MKPDTTGTKWSKHGMQVAVAEVLPERGMVRIRIASAPESFGWVAMMDPKTGGPRGYVRVEPVAQAPVSCDCTGAPHAREVGCPTWTNEAGDIREGTP